MTRSSCHVTRVDLTPLSDGSSETPDKIMLPNREPFRYGGWCSFFAYIAHFSQKSKLYGRSKANFCHAMVVKFQSLVNILGVGRQNFDAKRAHSDRAASVVGTRIGWMDAARNPSATSKLV